ncbi:MAG: hypothetical protein CEE40_03125 [Chloroflexi bacterium B3_Chlor]|nr:MAG: hypothetical protein CEE40_03125 [Chloroflexi bacterium B3_Chlor]
MESSVNFFRKIYRQEEESLGEWLGRHKLLLFGLVVAAVLMILYFKYRAPFLVLRDMLVVAHTPLWGGLLLAVWLAGLTVRAYRVHKVAEQREFVEDFRHGLDQWEYYGAWRTEKEDRRHLLTVTESGDGGIARPCLLWRDYDFEFDTKIVRGNTTWLIRARDILNYAMLQCGQSELYPHFRVNGMWVRLPRVSLSTTLPLNTWFRVRIRVQGTRVTAKVTVDDAETEIYNWDLLRPNVRTFVIGEGDRTQRADLILSYPVGSIGFREWSDTECAQFRNVRVSKI